MATDTILNIIKSRNPSLWGKAQRDDYIALSEMLIGTCAFKTKYNYAVALCTLHMLALDARFDGTEENPNSVTGNLESEKEDKLAVKLSGIPISNSSESAKYYNQTTYGQQLMVLRKACLFMPRTRLMSC